MNLLRPFFTAWVISFAGSLPVGTLNVAALQISMAVGIRSAFSFSAGAILMETAFVWVALVAMHWVLQRAWLLRVFDVLTLDRKSVV